MNESPHIDEHALMAYLDGELAEPEASAVEEAVASDPDVEERLRELAFSDAMLRASVRSLAARSRSEGTDGVADDPRILAFSPRRVPTPLALAAGLLLTVAAGVVGFAIRPALVAPGEITPAAAHGSPSELGAAVLQAGLENDLSGAVRSWDDPERGLAGGVTPVRSWQDRNGRFCREFTAWHGAGNAEVREHGVACRDESGLWRVRMRYYPE